MKTVLAPLALALAAGCAQIPPEHDVLPQRALAGAQLAADIHLARDGWPQAQWWLGYGDPQLTVLVQQALAGAPGLASASTRLASARAALAADRADQGASVDLALGANRQRYSGNGLFPEPIGGNFYNDLSVQVGASYDFDWWGRHRAQIAAALGEVNARQAEYAQAELVLASAVAQSYFSLQGGNARLVNLRAIIAADAALLEERERRIAHGLASADEREAAALELAGAQRQAAQLEAQNRREREALRALLGAGPEALATLTPHALNGAAHALPATLGLALLARRPDLQAARWRVQASLSRIEASQAAFYPDINLRASFGLDAVSLGTLLKPNSRTLFGGPTLTLPLFDSGRLQAGLELARSGRNEMVADYNQQVVDAVREVAQQGIALQGIEAQLGRQAEASRAADALLRTARARAGQGLADRASVLNAQLAQLRQQDARLQLQSTQLQAEVALTKALGGGYWAEAQQGVAAPSIQN